MARLDMHIHQARAVVNKGELDISKYEYFLSYYDYSDFYWPEIKLIAKFDTRREAKNVENFLIDLYEPPLNRLGTKAWVNRLSNTNRKYSDGLLNTIRKDYVNSDYYSSAAFAQANFTKYDITKRAVSKIILGELGTHNYNQFKAEIDDKKKYYRHGYVNQSDLIRAEWSKWNGSLNAFSKHMKSILNKPIARCTIKSYVQ
jgi:hypothetical protein